MLAARPTRERNGLAAAHPLPGADLTSTEDHVVPPVSGALIAGAIKASRIERVALEHSYHVATLDNDQDKTIAESLRLIGAVASGLYQAA